MALQLNPVPLGASATGTRGHLYSRLYGRGAASGYQPDWGLAYTAPTTPRWLPRRLAGGPRITEEVLGEGWFGRARDFVTKAADTIFWLAKVAFVLTVGYYGGWAKKWLDDIRYRYYESDRVLASMVGRQGDFFQRIESREESGPCLYCLNAHVFTSCEKPETCAFSTPMLPCKRCRRYFWPWEGARPRATIHLPRALYQRAYHVMSGHIHRNESTTTNSILMTHGHIVSQLREAGKGQDDALNQIVLSCQVVAYMMATTSYVQCSRQFLDEFPTSDVGTQTDGGDGPGGPSDDGGPDSPGGPPPAPPSGGPQPPLPPPSHPPGGNSDDGSPPPGAGTGLFDDAPFHPLHRTDTSFVTGFGALDTLWEGIEPFQGTSHRLSDPGGADVTGGSSNDAALHFDTADGDDPVPEGGTPPEGLEAWYLSGLPVSPETGAETCEDIVPVGTLGTGYRDAGLDGLDLVSTVRLREREPEAWPERYVAGLEVLEATDTADLPQEKDQILRAEQRCAQYMVSAVGVTRGSLADVYVTANTKANQRAAIAGRHYAEADTGNGNPVGNVLTQHHSGLRRVALLLANVMNRAEKGVSEWQRLVNYNPNWSPSAADVNRFKEDASSPEQLHHIEYVDLLGLFPGSMTEQAKARVLDKIATATSNDCSRPKNKRTADLAQDEAKKWENRWKYRKNFFCKTNEALKKVKPRLIQHSNEEGSAGDLPSAMLNKLWFGLAVMLDRSIKKASGESWRYRLSAGLSGYAYYISLDYAKFDSAVRNRSKDIEHGGEVREMDGIARLVEQPLLEALFADKGDSFLHALRERAAKVLRSTSAFWTMVAEVFGRLSGDRGTSVLNFIENLALFLYVRALIMGTIKKARKCAQDNGAPPGAEWFEKTVRSGEAFCEASVQSWLNGYADGYDLKMAEGDDGLPAFTGEFIDGLPISPAPGQPELSFDDKRRFLGKLIMDCYRDCGFAPEPQCATGTLPDEEAIQERIEFCSKIVLPFTVDDKNSYVVVLPKVRKSVMAGDVMFGFTRPYAKELAQSSQHFLDAATKHLAMAFNNIDAALPFEYFMAQARHGIKAAGRRRKDFPNGLSPKAYADEYYIDSTQFVAKVMWDELNHEMAGNYLTERDVVKTKGQGKGKKGKGKGKGKQQQDDGTGITFGKVYNRLRTVAQDTWTIPGQVPAQVFAWTRECPAWLRGTSGPDDPEMLAKYLDGAEELRLAADGAGGNLAPYETAEAEASALSTLEEICLRYRAHLGAV